MGTSRGPCGYIAGPAVPQSMPSSASTLDAQWVVRASDGMDRFRVGSPSDGIGIRWASEGNGSDGIGMGMGLASDGIGDTYG